MVLDCIISYSPFTYFYRKSSAYTYNSLINRGSYMCAHVLLYMGAHVLLNLRVGKTAILSLFRNKFIKFNNTGVRVVDSI